MKLNLANLANQVSEQHKDIECSFGKIRVYHVPEPLIWMLKPDWSLPSVPQKEMELVTGQVQVRPVRKDSPEYQAWEAENSRWTREQREIQQAGRYVLALRDVEYPADLSQPPPFLRDYLNGHYPENELLRKKTWLDATVLAHAADLAMIMTAIVELGGGEMVSAEDVDEVKKSSESDSEVTDLSELELEEAVKIQ